MCVRVCERHPEQGERGVCPEKCHEGTLRGPPQKDGGQTVQRRRRFFNSVSFRWSSDKEQQSGSHISGEESED